MKTCTAYWTPLYGEQRMCGAHKEEHMIHRHFTALRVEGEWFRPELPLIEHILKARKVGVRAPEGLPELDLLELGRMVRRLRRAS